RRWSWQMLGYNRWTAAGSRRNARPRLPTRISPSLAAAATFAMSGAAFALGNLLLARQMHTEDYARLALAIAIFIVVSQVATLGYSQIALRERLHPGRALLLRLLAQGVVAGAIAAMLAG